MTFPKINMQNATGSDSLQNMISSVANLQNLEIDAQRKDRLLARQQQVIPQLTANTANLAQLGNIGGGAGFAGVPNTGLQNNPSGLIG
jgi:hypothetical protein